MSTKRVSFLATLVADESKRQAMEASYANAKSGTDSARVEPSPASSGRKSTGETPKPEPHSVPTRPVRNVTSTSENHSEETTATRDAGSHSTVERGEGLERIEAHFGRAVAYDTRYCVWFTRDGDRTRDSFDIRHIAERSGMSVQDVIEALPEFKPVKRGRASETPEESE